MAGKTGGGWAEIIDTLSGVLDVELDAIAESLAAMVPDDSWFRGERMRRLFGVVKQGVEHRLGSSGLSPILKVLAERFIDLGDAVSNALGGKSQVPYGGGGSSHTAKTDHAKVPAWYPEWQKQAAERLKSATDPADEGKKLAIELAVLLRLDRKHNLQPKKKTPTPKPANWSAATNVVRGWNTNLHNALKRRSAKP